MKSKISRLTLALTLVLFLTGASNKLQAQFNSTGTFVVTNSSGCDVDVFFEFENLCGTAFVCCVGGYVVHVPAFSSKNVNVSAYSPSGDALMRVYPYGYSSGAYYFGDFSTGPMNGCFTPSIGAGTTGTGDDCNGAPNALHAVVNATPGCNCMSIY